MPSHNVINLSHACICSVLLPSKSKSFDITRNRIGEFQWQVLEQHRDIRLFRTRGLGPLESLQRKATPGGIQIRRLSHLNWLSQHLYPKLKSTISFFCCCLFFVLFFCCPPKAHDRSWGLERRLTGFAFRLSSLFTTSLAQCLRYSADATWIQLSISGYISPSLVNKTLSYLICFTCSGCSHRLLASGLEE